MTKIPPLPPHCGSWVVVNRATGESVLETFSRAVAERVNQDAYEVLTAAEWLGSVNVRAREASSA
mgnify:CR=1 FL=1